SRRRVMAKFHAAVAGAPLRHPARARWAPLAVTATAGALAAVFAFYQPWVTPEETFAPVIPVIEAAALPSDNDLDAMKTLYAAGSAAILPGNAEVQHEVLADANSRLEPAI